MDDSSSLSLISPFLNESLTLYSPVPRKSPSLRVEKLANEVRNVPEVPPPRGREKVSLKIFRLGISENCYYRHRLCWLVIRIWGSINFFASIRHSSKGRIRKLFQDYLRKMIGHREGAENAVAGRDQQARRSLVYPRTRLTPFRTLLFLLFFSPSRLIRFSRELRLRNP